MLFYYIVQDCSFLQELFIAPGGVFVNPAQAQEKEVLSSRQAPLAAHVTVDTQHSILAWSEPS